MKAKKVYESHGLGDFLKPKSEEDIVNSFRQASVSDQIEFLEKKQGSIPEEFHPLIYRLLNTLTDDPNFNYNFIYTKTFEPIIYSTDHDSTKIGVIFRIYLRRRINKDPEMPWTMVEQLDDELDNVRVYLKNNENKKSKFVKIYSVEQLKKWLFKTYREFVKINESVENNIHSVLKPKGPSDIIKLFREYNISSQIEFIEENRKLVPLSEWPLMLQIKEALKNNQSFDLQFRCRQNESIYSPDGYVIGFSFEIIYRNNDWAKRITVEQYDREPHNIRVYADNTANEQIIEDYSGFIKWLNDDYIYNHKKAGYEEINYVNESAL